MSYTLPTDAAYRYGSSGNFDRTLSDIALGSDAASKVNELVFGSNGEQYFKYATNQIADLVAKPNGGTQLVVFDYAATDDSKRTFSEDENIGSIFVDVNAVGGKVVYKLVAESLMKVLEGGSDISGEFFAYNNIGFDIAMLEKVVVVDPAGGSKLDYLVDPSGTINARIVDPFDDNEYIKMKNGVYRTKSSPYEYREHQDNPDSIALHEYLYDVNTYPVGTALYTNKIENSGAEGSFFKTDAQGIFYRYDKLATGLIKRIVNGTSYFYITSNSNETIYIPALNYALSNANSGDKIYVINYYDSVTPSPMQIASIVNALGGGAGSYTSGGVTYYEVPTLTTTPTLKMFATQGDYAVDAVWRQVDLDNSRAMVHEYGKTAADLVERRDYDASAPTADFSAPYNYKAYTEGGLKTFAEINTFYVEGGYTCGFDRTLITDEPETMSEIWKNDNNATDANIINILNMSNAIYRSYHNAITREFFATMPYFNANDILVEMSGAVVQPAIQLAIDGLLNISTSTDYINYSISSVYESYNANGIHQFSINTTYGIAVNDTCLNKNESPNVTYTRVKTGVLNNGTKFYADGDYLGYEAERYAFAHGDSPYNVSHTDLFIMDFFGGNYDGTFPTTNQYEYISLDFIKQTFEGKTTHYSYLGSGVTLKQFAVDTQYSETYWQEINNLGVNVNPEYEFIVQYLVKETNASNYKAYGEEGLGAFATNNLLYGSVGFDYTTSGSEIISETWGKEDNNILYNGGIYRSYFSEISRFTFATNYTNGNILVEMNTSPYAILNIIQKVTDGLINISGQNTIEKYNSYEISTIYESYNANGLHEFSMNTNYGIQVNDTCLNTNESPNVTYTRAKTGLIYNDTKFYADSTLGYEAERFYFAHGVSPYNVPRTDLFIMSFNNGNYPNDYENIPVENQYVYVRNDLIYLIDTNNGNKKTYFTNLNFGYGLSLESFANNENGDVDYVGTYWQEIDNVGVNTGAEQRWIAINLVHNQSNTSEYKAYSEGAVAYAARESMNPFNEDYVILVNAGDNLAATTYVMTYDENLPVVNKQSTSEYFAFGGNYDQYNFYNNYSVNDVMKSYLLNPSIYDDHSAITLSLQDTLNMIDTAAVLVTTNTNGKSYSVFTDVGLANVAKIASPESTTINYYDNATYTYIAQYLVNLNNVYSYSSTDEESIRYDFASNSGKFVNEDLNGKTLRIIENSNYSYYYNSYSFVQSNVILGSGYSTDHLSNNYVIQDTYLVLSNALTLQDFAADTSKEGYFWQTMNGSGIAQADKWAWTARNLVNKLDNVNVPTSDYNAYTRGALAYLAITGYFGSASVTLMDDPLAPLDPSGTVYDKVNGYGWMSGIMQQQNTGNYYGFGVSNNIYFISYQFATSNTFNNTDTIYVFSASGYTESTTDSVTIDYTHNVYKKADGLVLVETISLSQKKYEAYSPTGVENAFALTQTDMNQATTNVIYNDVDEYDFTWVAQYTLSRSGVYYSDCNSGRLTENVQRLAFSRSQAPYGDVVVGNELIIVGTYYNLYYNNSPSYVFRNINKTISHSENGVDVYYLAPDSTYTLKDFAGDLNFNDGDIYQPMLETSGDNDTSIRYSWYAINLAEDRVISNHYMAFSEGAVAYACYDTWYNMTIDLSQNTGSVLENASYNVFDQGVASRDINGNTSYYFFGTGSKENFANFNIYAPGSSADLFGMNPEYYGSNNRTYITITAGDHMYKQADGLILVTTTSNVKTYESYSNSGVANAFALTSSDIADITDQIVLYNNDSNYTAFTWKAQYVLLANNSNQYYADCTDGKPTENAQRIAFAKKEAPYDAVATGDVLYIVSGYYYYLEDNTPYYATSANETIKRNEYDVNNDTWCDVYYVSDTSSFTLKNFAENTDYNNGIYFGHIYQPMLSSGANNTSIRYSWYALNLAKDEVSANAGHYMAFSEGAVAYSAFNLSNVNVELTQNPDNNLSNATYYSHITGSMKNASSSEYYGFNGSISHSDFATGTTYVSPNTLKMYTTNATPVDSETTSYTLTANETLTKTDTDLILVTGSTSTPSDYYESFSSNGLHNAALLPATPSVTLIKDVTQNPVVEYTWKSQYTLKSGTAYYSYSAYDEVLNEPQIRYEFASLGNGFADASNNDVMYIVVDVTAIDSGNSYTMIDTVNGLILGHSSGNNYIAPEYVDNVYFSNMDNANHLTLPQFADNIVYDGYHFKYISSPSNLNDATIYSWTAKNLVAEKLATDNLVAFTDGALAYIADQMTGSKVVERTDNAVPDGTQTKYYLQSAMGNILTNLSSFTDSTVYWAYDAATDFDITHQQFATDGTYYDASVPDVLYEKQFSTDSVTPLNHAVYTQTTYATITKKDTDLIEVVETVGAVTYFEAWSNAGVYNGSKSVNVSAGSEVRKMNAATATFINRANGLLDLVGASPKAFYSFNGVGLTEELRRLALAEADAAFVDLAAGQFLYIVPDNTVAYTAFTAKYEYLADSNYPTGMYVAKYVTSPSTYKQFMVVNVDGSGSNFDRDYTPDAVSYTLANFSISFSAQSPNKWSVMDDSTGVVISSSVFTAQGFEGLLKYDPETNAYYAGSEAALAYAARATDAGAISSGAKIVLDNEFDYSYVPEYAGYRVWFKYGKGVLVHYTGYNDPTSTLSNLDDSAAVAFRSYNDAIAETTLAGVPLVLYDANEKLAVIDYSGNDGNASSFIMSNLTFKKMVTRNGTESLKVVTPIVGGTVSFEAFGPTGLYEIAALTSGISSGNYIYRRNFGAKLVSGNYDIDASTNELLRTFTWVEQYLLKDISSNSAGAEIYYDYIDNSTQQANLNNDLYNFATTTNAFASATNGAYLYDMSGSNSGSWSDFNISDNTLYVLDTSGAGASTNSYMVVKQGTNNRYLMVTNRKAEFAGDAYYAINATYAEITSAGEVSNSQRIKAATDLLQIEGSSTQFESYSEGGLQTYATTATTYDSTQIKLVSGTYSTKLNEVVDASTGTVWHKGTTNNIIVDYIEDPNKHRVYNNAITPRYFAETNTYDIGEEMLIVSSDLVLASYIYVLKRYYGLNFEDNQYVNGTSQLYNAVAYTYGGLYSAANNNGFNGVVDSSGDVQSYILYDYSGSTTDITYTKVQNGLIEIDGNGVIPSNFFSYVDVSLVQFAHSVEQNVNADVLDLAFVDNSENSVLYDLTGMATTADPTTSTKTYRFVTKGVIDPTGSASTLIAGSDYSVYNIASNDVHAYLRRAALYNGVAAEDVPTGSTIGFADISYAKLGGSYPYGLLSYTSSNNLSYVSYLNGSLSGETLINSTDPVLSARTFANDTTGLYSINQYIDMRTADASGTLDSKWKKFNVSTLLKVDEVYDISYSYPDINTKISLSLSGDNALYHLYDYSQLANMANSMGYFSVSGDYIGRYVKIEDISSSKFGNIYKIGANGTVLDIQTTPATTIIVVNYRVLATSANYDISSAIIYLNESSQAVYKYAYGLLRKVDFDGPSGEAVPKNVFYAYTTNQTQLYRQGLRSAARAVAGVDIATGASVPAGSTIYELPFAENDLGLGSAVTHVKSAAYNNMLVVGSGASAVYREFDSYNTLNPHTFAADINVINGAGLKNTDSYGRDLTTGLNSIVKYNSRTVNETSSTTYWAFPASGSVYASNITMETLALDAGVAASASIREVLNTATFVSSTPTYSQTNDYTKESSTYANTLKSTDTDISAAYYTYVADAGLNLVLNNYANQVNIAGLDLTGTSGTNNLDLLTAPVYPYIFDISGNTKIQYTHKDTGVLLKEDGTYHAYSDNGVVRAAQLDEIGNATFTQDYPVSQTFTRAVDGIVYGGSTYSATVGGNAVLIYFKNVNNTPDDDRNNAYRVIKALARDVSGVGISEYSSGSIDLSGILIVYDVLETSPAPMKYEYVANGILKTTNTSTNAVNYIAYTDIRSTGLADIATNNGVDISNASLIRDISAADTYMDNTIDYVKHADGLLMATAADGTYDAITANAYPYSERGVANYAALSSRTTYDITPTTNINGIRVRIAGGAHPSSVDILSFLLYDVNNIQVPISSYTNSPVGGTITSGHRYLFTTGASDRFRFERNVPYGYNTTYNTFSFNTLSSTIKKISIYTDQWQMTDFKIEFTTDNGATWTQVAAATNANRSITFNNVLLSMTGNVPSIPTSLIPTPFIWKQKGVVVYDASANAATQFITRSSPYTFANSASKYNARVYTSSIVDLSGYIDLVATTNNVASDYTYYKPGIYIEVGDATGSNTTSSRTNSYQVQKIEDFLMKDSRISAYNAYENLITYDGLARAALNDLPANTQVILNGTTWTKDVSGALMSSNATTFKHYTGSANPTLFRTAFTSPIDISNALYKISSIATSTLSAYKWTAAYALSESQFAYKLDGIVTPLPDISSSGTKIDDDIIFGATGINSFSTSSIYPSGTTNNNVYANAPTNYTVSSRTKSSTDGVAVNGNTVQVTKQAAIAGVSGENPNPNTIVNSLEFMFTLIKDLSNVVVQPSADMSGAVYRIAQATVYDTQIDSALDNVVYNMITNPLYADDDVDSYYYIYRAITSRSTVTITSGQLLTDGSISNTKALFATNVPASVLNATDPAIKKNTLNIYIYADVGKTFGYKYTMDVYRVPVA